MKCVYIDRCGNRAFDTAYDGAMEFSEGLAAVRFPDYFCGFINTTGELVIEPKFTEAARFSEGLARVKVFHWSQSARREVWRFIDKSGNIVIDADYRYIADFSEGVAVAGKGDEIFFIDNSCNELFKLNREEVFIDVAGNARFSDGLIPAMNVANRKWGYLDRFGSFAVAPQFHNAAGFSEGLARVSVSDGNAELVGFIGRTGEFVIPPKFDVDFDFIRCSSDFSEGLAGLVSGPLTLEGDQHFIYINNRGDVVLETEFFFADQFHGGLAAVFDADTGTYGFIDTNGRISIPLGYVTAGQFSEGLAAVTLP